MKVCLRCSHKFVSDQWTCPACGTKPECRAGFLCFAPELAAANEGFSADYFARLAELEPDHFWFRARNQLIQWAFKKHFSSSQTFLEVGCGTGFVLTGIRRQFPNLRVAGTDVFTEGLGFARERLPGVELFQMDARKIPFEAEYDVIGAFDVLEHIAEDEQVLTEFYRCCKPGGGMILTVPQHRFLWSAADEYAYHKRRYTRQELLSKVAAAGFEVSLVTSFVSALLPMMFVSRLRHQKLDASFDPYDEFTIGRAVNRSLEFVLSAERKLIEARVSLPAGGSLLVIARRIDG